MRPQRFGRVVDASQFRFGQCGVDFAVANMVQQHCWPAFAPFELRDQVMHALWHIGWDWAAT